MQRIQNVCRNVPLLKKRRKGAAWCRRKNAPTCITMHGQPRQYQRLQKVFFNLHIRARNGRRPDAVAALVLLILRAIKYAPEGKTGLYCDQVLRFFAVVNVFAVPYVNIVSCAYAPYGFRKVFSNIKTYLDLSPHRRNLYRRLHLQQLKGVRAAGWCSASFGELHLLGIVFYGVSLVERMRNISVATYIILGWLIVFTFNPVAQKVPRLSIAFLISGGIAYTVGCVFYFMKKYKWTHSIFHSFVIVGSVMHFFSIYFSIPHMGTVLPA